jgi:hypothetical protein
MQTIGPAVARQLIDFAPRGGQLAAALGDSQLDGAVAVFNMLVRNRLAYLADEVGMGKTYVALGAMSLFRHFNPKARIMVIAPRANIQQKWLKELTNFIRLNWLPVDSRVKAIQGTPDWPPVICESLHDFVHEALVHPDRDFLMRMTSFSPHFIGDKQRQDLRSRLRDAMPWLPTEALGARSDEVFRDQYGAALNAAMPSIDLLIVDEGHNLKHGYSRKVSTRNRLMGLAFGHPSEQTAERPWYRPKLVKNLLLLSATPFEDDYGAIQRQCDIFGFGDAKLAGPAGGQRRPLTDLLRSDASEQDKRDLVSRMMVRRVTKLEIAGRGYTKNMYRREWRRGGYERHDEPMKLSDPKERLIVALMQKKVAEILQHERFGNQFQIGMLSSFESFLESLKRERRAAAVTPENGEGEDAGATFHGEQDATEEERHGVDTQAISRVVESYRETFKHGLPHPKLDATARALQNCFATGDKALIFVRRILTVEELAAKLDAYFDDWIRQRMDAALPALRSEIDALFEQYSKERGRRPEERIVSAHLDPVAPDGLDGRDQRGYLDAADPGSAETFFAWFFRGEGPAKVMSGAAFQKNRLASPSSAYATLFEDDYVSWLLANPAEPLVALAAATGLTPEALEPRLRDAAFARLGKQKEGYSRIYVFEGYQIAALELLSACKGELGLKARVILGERFPGEMAASRPAPAGFPGPRDAIGIKTVFTELSRRPALRAKLWPEETSTDFRSAFRRREQRRELFSAMARLGASYIDLYLLAMQAVGSFKLRAEAAGERANEALAAAFVDLLEQEANVPGFHAYRELSEAAAHFDLILAVNFPAIAEDETRLADIAAIYGQTLQRQVPVGRVWGGVNKRLVRQFRMPGFPIVLVTTDVLQEGEDLHTFCQRVIHYGITWTASAMEQRTGRVDRIASQAQRRLQQAGSAPTAEEFIQVYYPHLEDTVELLQVRRVLKRLNDFFRLIHETGSRSEDKSHRIDMAREVMEELSAILPFTDELKSAFPVTDAWKHGEHPASALRMPDYTPHLRHFGELWAQLVFAEGARPRDGGGDRMRRGDVEHGVDGRPTPVTFELELRSQTSGTEILCRCSAQAGYTDLDDGRAVSALGECQEELGGPRICVRREEKERRDRVWVEGDILFTPETSLEEVADIWRRTTRAAGKVGALLNPDGALP